MHFTRGFLRVMGGDQESKRPKFVMVQYNGPFFVHTATRCNALQHTATESKRPEFVMVQYNGLFFVHTVTYCNTLQHTATHCNGEQAP